MNTLSLIRVAAAAALACCTTFAAAAPVVFEQSPANGVSSAWTSHLGVGQGGYQAFDDFSVGRGATIGQVSWHGTYFTAGDGGLRGAQPNTEVWTVEFWSGNAAGPMQRLYSQDHDPAQVTRTWVQKVDPTGLNMDLYAFTLDLAQDFDAEAGQTYWFSVVSKAGSFSPFFSWTNADPAGATFQHMQDGQGQVLAGLVRNGDRAFSLRSHAVPEPASVALVALALLAGGLRVRGRARA